VETDSRTQFIAETHIPPMGVSVGIPSEQIYIFFFKVNSNFEFCSRIPSLGTHKPHLVTKIKNTAIFSAAKKMK